jgi:hypothetical protein
VSVRDKHAYLKALRGCRDLSHADFRLLVMVLTYTDARGRNAFPGARNLAADMGVKDADAVRARLSDLVSRGYLTVMSAGGSVKGGTRQANSYEVWLPGTATTGDQPGGSDVLTTRAEVGESREIDHPAREQRPPGVASVRPPVASTGPSGQRSDQDQPPIDPPRSRSTQRNARRGAADGNREHWASGGGFWGERR